MPHNEKRFPGYDKEEKALDAETHRKYIFGGHVQEYMEMLQVPCRKGGGGREAARGSERASGRDAVTRP